jgi:hypothetical protein
MTELKNHRWRRCKNPVPKHWPGTWIEWRLDHFAGKCWLGQVRDYLGISRGVQIESAIGAGKRAGKL